MKAKWIKYSEREPRIKDLPIRIEITPNEHTGFLGAVYDYDLDWLWINNIRKPEPLGRIRWQSIVDSPIA